MNNQAILDAIGKVLDKYVAFYNDIGCMDEIKHILTAHEGERVDVRIPNADEWKPAPSESEDTLDDLLDDEHDKECRDYGLSKDGE